jgi:hypothetical protein
MPSIRPYGAAMTDAIASGDVSKLREAAAAAEQYLAENGNLPKLLQALKVEIAKAEARQAKK